MKTTPQPNAMQQPRSGRTRVVVIAIIAACLLFTGVIIAAGNGRAVAEGGLSIIADDSWFTVQSRDFDLTVIASGEVEARDNIEVVSKVDGRPTIIEIVDEGSRVVEGQVLVKLADDELRDKIEQEKLNVERARADFIAAEQNLVIQENEAQNSEKQASVKLDLALLELEKWQNGDLVQKRQQLQLGLEKAKRTLSRARDNLELSRQLHAEQFISKAEVEDDELKLIEAESSLQTAMLDIEVYENYGYPREMKKFNSDVEQARAELERTQRKYASELARGRADLAGKRRQLTIREELLRKLEVQLAATEIRAPQDGLVVYATSVGARWRRSEPIRPGRQVRVNESIIILPDTRHMVAALKVHEAMLPRVSPGQKVSVTIDARPGEMIPGEVTQIAVMAEDGGWMNPDLREYIVKVKLPPQEVDSLKPSMSCKGEIVIGRVENALAVPVQSVFTEGQDRFCYVPAGSGRVRRQIVKIGQASETFVEILEGLTPGDRVMLRTPRPQELAIN